MLRAGVETWGQASSLPVHGASSHRVSSGSMTPELADKMFAQHFQTRSKTFATRRCSCFRGRDLICFGIGQHEAIVMTGEGTSLEPPPLPKPLWLRPFVVGRKPRWTLVRVAIVVVTSLVLFKFVLIPIRIVGISMEPTYPNGRWNFINKLAYRTAPPKRGDVVAVRMAGEHVLLLKRIIGAPGDRVTMSRQGVFVNGRRLDENYVKLRIHWTWNRHREWSLGEDEYLLIGDNRSMFFEDHYKGKAFAFQIVGKILF